MRGRLESLPLPALMLVGVLVLVGTGVAGYYAYETYDYIEHDNEFCFSCHLMQQPYELFAQSAHRGLGCKACHQPNLLERSQMGATAVIFDPDEVSAHAAVPNDLCADCHINGDPDKWLLVAQSAGHRVHLESEDPSLDGLQCVECHASSLHEFAAVDRTCAQSGCHTDSAIQLGAMSDLTIHCAACHGFSAPVETAEEGLAALAPDESTCLSCHAMRVLVELPNPDPHEASCASCHNPHEQQTPEEAVASCATADCHSEPVSITAFHEGLEPAVLQDCLSYGDHGGFACSPADVTRRGLAHTSADVARRGVVHTSTDGARRGLTLAPRRGFPPGCCARCVRAPLVGGPTSADARLPALAAPRPELHRMPREYGESRAGDGDDDP